MVTLLDWSAYFKGSTLWAARLLCFEYVSGSCWIMALVLYEKKLNGEYDNVCRICSWKVIDSMSLKWCGLCSIEFLLVALVVFGPKMGNWKFFWDTNRIQGSKTCHGHTWHNFTFVARAGSFLLEMASKNNLVSEFKASRWLILPHLLCAYEKVE